MDEFEKSIRLVFTVDDATLREAEKKVDAIADTGLFSGNDLRNIKGLTENLTKLEFNIDKMKEGLESLDGIFTDEANAMRASIEQTIKELEAEHDRLTGKADKDRKERAKETRRAAVKAIGGTLGEFAGAASSGFSGHDSALSKVFEKGSQAVSKGIELGTDFLSGALSGDFEDFTDSLKDLAASFIESMAKLVADAFDEMNSILGANRLSNAETRELAMQYGFNAAEVYAWQKANEYLGFNSEEDLFYATQGQRDKFVEIFSEFADKYNTLYDSGTFDQLEEFEVEMKKMKDELLLEVVTWFMNNKDTLKELMKTVLKFTESMLELFGTLVKHWNGDFSTRSHMTAEDAERINNYAQYGGNTTVKIDNSFTNVAKEDQAWLANAGQLTYQQVIRALGGTT